MMFSFEYGLFIWVWSFHLGMVSSFGYSLLIWVYMVFSFGYGLFIRVIDAVVGSLGLQRSGNILSSASSNYYTILAGGSCMSMSFVNRPPSPPTSRLRMRVAVGDGRPD